MTVGRCPIGSKGIVAYEKAVILTGIATLFLATGTAHADNKPLPRIDPLIGGW
jgi:hypothetical protein